MASKKQIIRPVVFMLVLTILYTFVLAYINVSTFDIIKEQEDLRVKRSVLYVLGQPSTDTDAVVTELFNEKVEVKVDGDQTTYVYTENGTLSGYAYEFKGNALWGSLTGYIGLSPDYSTVLGIDFVAHSETPGLGGRIDEPWFKEQFRGLPISETTVVYRPNENAVLDAITGATLTSDAVRNTVNKFIKDILIYAEGGNL